MGGTINLMTNTLIKQNEFDGYLELLINEVSYLAIEDFRPLNQRIEVWTITFAKINGHV